MDMQQWDVIIVGSGAAGLMAAYELSNAGNAVCILEARERIGGRIYTLKEFDGRTHIEGGAEFVHGRLPLTSELAHAAGLDLIPIRGKTWQVKKNKLYSGSIDPDWKPLMNALGKLKEDMPFSDFLATHFNEDQHQTIRNSAIQFVEGYDAADIHKISTMALRDEWNGEGDHTQFRIKGGYSGILEFLREKVQARGGVIHLSKVVKKISWKPGSVDLFTEENECFIGRKVIITVPIGVLRTRPIHFIPDLPRYVAASEQIGYGGVIKFFLQFKFPFWEEGNRAWCRKMPSLHFLFSDALIPTWWPQLPDEVPLLTGWLGGPSAEKQRERSEHELLEESLHALAYLFGIHTRQLKEWLHSWKIINWINDLYSRGAYAYSMVGAEEAKRTLLNPVSETIYFCGEALYSAVRWEPWRRRSQMPEKLHAGC